MKQINTCEVIDQQYYYVDKTQFIKGVFNDKIMLYTRPRCFGKTLNIRKFYCFLSNKNACLFDGLKISANQNIINQLLCDFRLDEKEKSFNRAMMAIYLVIRKWTTHTVFCFFTVYLRSSASYHENSTPILNTYHLVILIRKSKRYMEVSLWIGLINNRKKTGIHSSMTCFMRIQISRMTSYLTVSAIMIIMKAFYHEFIIGFLTADGYQVKSNRESEERRINADKN